MSEISQSESPIIVPGNPDLADLARSGRLNIADTLKPIAERNLDVAQKAQLLLVFLDTFRSNPKHYKRLTDVKFTDIWRALESDPDLMRALFNTQMTGGQPDVIAIKDNKAILADCYKDSPGQREILQLTYPQIIELTSKSGLRLMPEDMYRDVLQGIGDFDTDTWTYLDTPENILRPVNKNPKRGRALQGCKRNGEIYIQQVMPDKGYEDDGYRFTLEVPMV